MMKKRNGSQRRRCRFESLERRNLLAGDVMARIVNGDLIIKGDQLDNGITIAAGQQANSVVVTGVDPGGSATNVNGTANGTVTLSGFTGNLVIKLKGGNDSVTITDLAVTGKLKIKGGRGDDTLSLDGVTVGRSLNLRAGNGSDTISLLNIDVTKSANVRGGDGNENVTVTDSKFTSLGMFLGDGNDTLNILGTMVSTRTALRGGHGTNTFTNGAGNTLTNLSQRRFTTSTVAATPPTIAISGAASVNEGAAYTLNLTSTGSGASSISQWQITWGDGSAVQTVSGNPSSATHTYTDGPKSYTISATASYNGSTITAGNTVAVTVNNVVPTLSISGAASVSEGAVYTLTLTSSDPGVDTISQWLITWGDGSAVQTVTGNPTSVTHTFADGLKTNTISAQAVDEDGTYTVGNTVAVTVNNVAPTLSISGAASVNEGAVYTLTLTSSDPGADTISQWLINWGDGSAVQTVTGNPTSVTHTFADGPKTNTISAQAVDEDGTYTVSNTVAVTVNNVAPSLSISGAASVSEGSVYTLTLSSSDPGADTISQWLINWGDGSAVQTVSGNPSSATHTYADGGNSHTISASAVDEDGTYAVGNTVAVTVNNVAPTLTISGAASVNEGATYTLSLASSDPGADTITQWLIFWGDGSATQTVSGNPANVTHTFADNGSYTVSAAATDEDGTFLAGNQLTVAVNNVAPTLLISGAASVNAGEVYTLGLSSSDPGTDTISQWQIDWGDGSAVETVSGNPSNATHTYASGPNNYTISAKATDEDGTFNAGNTVAVTVNATT